MAHNVTKFSDRGLPYGSGVDLDALTLSARYTVFRFPIVGTAYVQNATTKHNLGCVGVAGTVRGAYWSGKTVVAGGTLTGQLVAYDASGNAEVALTDTFNPESATAREGFALTLVTTNVALAADDTFEFHAVASDSAVTDITEGVLTVIFEPSEASQPTR